MKDSKGHQGNAYQPDNFAGHPLKITNQQISIRPKPKDRNAMKNVLQIERSSLPDLVFQKSCVSVLFFEIFDF